MESNNQDILFLKKRFDEADKNNNETLNFKEFKAILSEIGFDNNGLIKSLMNKFDTNDDNQIDFLGNILKYNIIYLYIFY